MLTIDCPWCDAPLVLPDRTSPTDEARCDACAIVTRFARDVRDDVEPALATAA
jgi:hypothetical protein